MTGNPNEYCGGDWALAVYRVRAVKSSVTYSIAVITTYNECRCQRNVYIDVVIVSDILLSTCYGSWCVVKARASSYYRSTATGSSPISVTVGLLMQLNEVVYVSNWTTQATVDGAVQISPMCLKPFFFPIRSH